MAVMPIIKSMEVISKKLRIGVKVIVRQVLILEPLRHTIR